MPSAEPFDLSTPAPAPTPSGIAVAKYALSYLGGGTLITSGFGFTIYLFYCTRIGYMPTLSVRNYTDLFVGLSVAGFATVLFFALVPFIPGLLLWLGGGQAHKATGNRDYRIAVVGLMLTTAAAGLAGFAYEYAKVQAAAGLPVTGTWIFGSLALACVAGMTTVVFLVRLERQLMNGSRSALDVFNSAVFSFGATVALVGLVFAYGPIVFWMSKSVGTELPARILFAAFVFELIAFGNLATAEARNPKARRAAVAFIALFALVGCTSLFSQFADRLLNQFGIGGIGPIEMVVREQDVSRVPASVRESLDVRPDATTRPNTFAIRGLYVVLRVGDELRIGITKDPRKEKSPTNPIVSSWSIPASAVLSWRQIEWADIDFPERSAAPTAGEH